MKLIFPGTGSFFTILNYNNMLMVESATGKHLLIDCGGDARRALHDMGYSATDIDAVYISHLHGDHFHGLEWLGYASYFAKKNKPILFAVPLVMNGIWESLRWSMRFLEGHSAEIQTYFSQDYIATFGPNPTSADWEGVNIKPVRTTHTRNGVESMVSYGVVLTEKVGSKTCRILVTGDTVFDETLYQDDYDLIIQDCETLDGIYSGVHAHYDQLRTLPTELKRKMMLVHYQDNVLLPDGSIDPKWKEKAWQDGFVNGFIPKGTKINV